MIDLFSRRVVGWTLRTSLHAEGAVEALNQAFRERGATGVITHHDRGVQYACGDYADILAAHNATLSMSRKGDCWDNAVAESFFSSLKRELGDTFDSFSEAIREVTLYITWYNAVRRHSHNDGLSPLRAELAYHHAQAAYFSTSDRGEGQTLRFAMRVAKKTRTTPKRRFRRMA